MFVLKKLSIEYVLSVFTRFDVPMFTWRDGLQRQAVEWKRRPVMLRGGVCA